MKTLIIFVLTLFMTTVGMSQEKVISGTVTSAIDGLPLPGVNVLVKGTSRGTQTNFDGHYKIKVVKGDILVFSFIGMKSKAVKVNGAVIINIALENDSESLQEVVVEAYRTATKETSNLASTTITVRTIEARPNANFAQTLQGQASGLNITTTNGQAIGNSAINLRGVSSLSGNTEPLFVVDGVPISEKSFRALNPKDIKSVNVIKDAGATAIYGNRGANGVVIISTKQGYYKAPEVKIADAQNESYENIPENEFERTSISPLSTFSIDVDKAAYSNIRRMINNGMAINPSAVKIEEMINYFTYNYPQPKDKHPFSINTDVSETPWNKETKLVKIGLQGKTYDNQELPASNLTFLIDVSGSMSNQNKLPLLKSAFKLLVGQLREKDKVSIVVYAGAAGVVLESTSGKNKEVILKALNNLNSGGSTAGGEGINLAYKIAHKNFIKNGNNRVILATDGDFNVGESSDEAMKLLIEDKRKSGVFLSVLGFGYGNYKDSKLETLADKGNGNHAYIDNMQEAQKVFGKEFGGTLHTIAKDVKIQIEFNPRKVKAYRLIGYENRLLEDQDFTDDTIDAGELGSGHTVTALYEVIPVGVKSDYLKEETELKYTQTAITKEYSDELFTVKFRYKKPDGAKSIEMIHIQKDEIIKGSKDLKFASAVALFGMQLRHSKYFNKATIEDVITLATEGRGEDKDGYRAEFIRLVKSM